MSQSRVTTSKARQQFADTVNRVAFSGERIVLSRGRKDVAALVPVKDLELLKQIEDAIDLDDARKALAEARRKGTISWTKLKSQLGL